MLQHEMAPCLLQRVAACCRELQCVASVLQCVAGDICATT